MPSTRALAGLQRVAGNAAVSRLVVQRLQASPSADPKFRALKSDIAAKQRQATTHPPAAHEASSAQGAAKPPADDKLAQGKVAQSGDMAAAKPGGFDKAAFVKAVNDAIAQQAPKNLDEADKYSSSGKADQVKSKVQGQVTDGKKESAQDIDQATKAAPDTSKATEKQVTPMAADHPPGTPGTPNPAQAIPDKAPASATDLSAGTKQVDSEMAQADVTEEQLAKSNEPEFKDALKAKKTNEQHAATAPGQVRAHEAQTLNAAKQHAATSGAAAMSTMAADRRNAGTKVGEGKEHAKGTDETKRAQVTGRLQKVFDATKKDVEGILSGLDKKVDSQFTAEEKQARDRFTHAYKTKVDAYKHKRYSGLMGKGRWIKDKFAGLPGEVNQFYDQARAGYVSDMQTVISRVADTIGGELGRAKQRIAKGRADLQAEVKKLPADLQSLGRQAAAGFSSKFDELNSTVDSKGQELVQTLATKYTAALKSVDDEIAKEKEKNKGLVAKAVDAVKGVINTIIELKNMLMGILAKAAAAISAIIKDPIGFLGKLISAVGAGLRQFIGNIADHLKKGVVSWLLGVTASAGLALPSKFDLKGIIQLVAGLLGLTWDFIRARVLRKGVPDQAVTAAEKAVPEAQLIQKEGLPGIWQQVTAKVGDLKGMILGKIASFLIPTVLIAGIMWVISLLNPASAFVRAVKAIIEIVQFIFERGAQIIAFVNAVLDAIVAIARGGAGGVPALIENALAMSIPILIGFLAAILGIGGLANKVKSFFQSLSKPVMKVVDWVVDKIAKVAKKLWAKLKSKFGKDKPGKDKPGQDGRPITPQQKEKALDAASTEAHRRLAAGASGAQMHSILEQVYRKYQPQGLSSLHLERTAEHEFQVVATGSPAMVKKGLHTKAPKEAEGDESALPLGPKLESDWLAQQQKKALQAQVEMSDETQHDLQNVLNATVEQQQGSARDDTTWARSVLKYQVPEKDSIQVRLAASGARLMDHRDVHDARGAHAEEQVTLHHQNVDLPAITAAPQDVKNMSMRYEISKSPCVNCATFIADFHDRNLSPKSSSRVDTTVATSSLYQGETVFTGEIMRRYSKIFEKFARPKKVLLLADYKKELQAKIDAEIKKNGKAKKNMIKDEKMRFSGSPGSNTTKRKQAYADRKAKWQEIPVEGEDVRPEWFYIRSTTDHGRVGLAILRAHGITVTALGGAALGLGHPDPRDAADRPLTAEEAKAMSQTDRDNREYFLDDLNARGKAIVAEINKIDAKLTEGMGSSPKQSEIHDKWVEEHGYVGSR